MALTIDAITRKKLILVKQLYQQAVVQSASQHSTIGRILSVIGFDLAIETALRAAVGSLDSSRTPADGFPGLIQQCDALFADRGCNPVPDKANVNFVHGIRNDAQHKAKYPNESDVNDCRTYCRDFLQKVIADIWGEDFAKINLTDAIQNDTAKQFLIGATMALSQNDFQRAIQQAAFGLDWALHRVETAVMGPLPSLRSDRLVTLLYIALGMNYADYMKYRQIAGYAYFVLDGPPQLQGGKENPDTNDAEWVVAYCTDTIVQIEGRVINLEAPFGSDR